VNTPYREFLKDHTAEVLDTFPTDGLFFDIVFPVPCICRYCREKILKAFSECFLVVGSVLLAGSLVVWLCRKTKATGGAGA
jgi:hypothetical protein